MLLLARLTWQAADPSALAADLAHRLGIAAVPGGSVRDSRLLHLGGALLEIRPWVREGPRDTPRAAGRLMLEPVPTGEEAPTGSASLRLAGLGWATVDLDRAADELSPWLADGTPLNTGDADPALGARARVRTSDGLPGDAMVFLEPSTEGRAAASLARDGEGPCALYLRPAVGLDAWLAEAVSRGVRASRGGSVAGPLGRQVLVGGCPPTGPHVILTTAA